MVNVMLNYIFIHQVPYVKVFSEGGITFRSNVSGLSWRFPNGIPYHCAAGQINLGGIKYADRNGKKLHGITVNYDMKYFLRVDNRFDFSKSRTFSVNTIAGRGGIRWETAQ